MHNTADGCRIVLLSCGSFPLCSSSVAPLELAQRSYLRTDCTVCSVKSLRRFPPLQGIIPMKKIPSRKKGFPQPTTTSLTPKPYLLVEKGRGREKRNKRRRWHVNRTPSRSAVAVTTSINMLLPNSFFGRHLFFYLEETLINLCIVGTKRKSTKRNNQSKAACKKVH